MLSKGKSRSGGAERSIPLDRAGVQPSPEHGDGMEFFNFSFIDIRSVILKKTLTFSNWLPFHENTQFKARAAIYHFERLKQIYEDYLKHQPIPDGQSAFNLEHPLKQIVFFEFLATISNLAGCFDSVLQEINCAYRLGLSERFAKGKPYVKLSTVLKELKTKFAKHELITGLNNLKHHGHEDNKWFIFLKKVRNTAIHSDIYTTSHETRNLNTIVKRIENKINSSETPISKDEFQSAVKRDIVITVEGQDYFMIGATDFLKNKMLEYVNDIHLLMVNDEKVG
jgi:hypothetical protein